MLDWLTIVRWMPESWMSQLQLFRHKSCSWVRALTLCVTRLRSNWSSVLSRFATFWNFTLRSISYLKQVLDLSLRAVQTELIRFEESSTRWYFCFQALVSTLPSSQSRMARPTTTRLSGTSSSTRNTSTNKTWYCEKWRRAMVIGVGISTSQFVSWCSLL